MLNAMGGMGMIAVGVLGSPLIGAVQDATLNANLKAQYPAIQASVVVEEPGVFGTKAVVNQSKLTALPEEERHAFDAVQSHAQQSALAKIAVLPAMMFVCYLILIAYFRARGGYEAQVLTGHAAEDDEFTGGLPAPGEA